MTGTTKLQLKPLHDFARRRADAAGVRGEDGDMFPDRIFAEMIGVSIRTIARWRQDGGRLEWKAADSAATHLGEHPVRVWGDEWLDLDKDFLNGNAPAKVYKDVSAAMKQIGKVLAEKSGTMVAHDDELESSR